ncbi:MAG: hypothetical protein M3298_05730 [Thermoproteota archaeon]|nr:hypothetical protein [Thermoproteota archaeon]
MNNYSKIYIDLDDVLCETALEFASLLENKYGRKVEFNQITSFDLGISFRLTPSELEEFLLAAHEPQVLGILKPVDGALEVVKLWHHKGYEIHIVTGRPTSTFEVSKQWLKLHDVPHTSLTFVDKYSRHNFNDTQIQPVPLTRLSEVGFCFAVEDSPAFASYLARKLNVCVALLDRPWNHLFIPEEDISAKIIRCRGWEDIIHNFDVFISTNGL